MRQGSQRDLDPTLQNHSNSTTNDRIIRNLNSNSNASTATASSSSTFLNNNNNNMQQQSASSASSSASRSMQTQVHTQVSPFFEDVEAEIVASTAEEEGQNQNNDHEGQGQDKAKEKALPNNSTKRSIWWDPLARLGETATKVTGRASKGKERKDRKAVEMLERASAGGGGGGGSEVWVDDVEDPQLDILARTLASTLPTASSTLPTATSATTTNMTDNKTKRGRDKKKRRSDAKGEDGPPFVGGSSGGSGHVSGASSTRASTTIEEEVSLQYFGEPPDLKRAPSVQQHLSDFLEPRKTASARVQRKKRIAMAAIAGVILLVLVGLATGLSVFFTLPNDSTNSYISVSRRNSYSLQMNSGLQVFQLLLPEDGPIGTTTRKRSNDNASPSSYLKQAQQTLEVMIVRDATIAPDLILVETTDWRAEGEKSTTTSETSVIFVDGVLFLNISGAMNSDDRPNARVLVRLPEDIFFNRLVDFRVYVERNAQVEVDLKKVFVAEEDSIIDSESASDIDRDDLTLWRLLPNSGYWKDEAIVEQEYPPPTFRSVIVDDNNNWPGLAQKSSNSLSLKFMQATSYYVRSRYGSVTMNETWIAPSVYFPLFSPVSTDLYNKQTLCPILSWWPQSRLDELPSFPPVMNNHYTNESSSNEEVKEREGVVTVRAGAAITLVDVLRDGEGSIDAFIYPPSATGNNNNAQHNALRDISIILRQGGFFGKFHFDPSYQQGVTPESTSPQVTVSAQGVLSSSSSFASSSQTSSGESLHWTNGTIGRGCQYISAMISSSSKSSTKKGDGAPTNNNNNPQIQLQVERVNPLQALGSVTRALIVHNTTLSRRNLLSGSCGGNFAPEYVSKWQAPADGTYSFDGEGSLFDATVYLLDATNGQELACSWRNPLRTVPLVGGQEVLVVVDGAYLEDEGGPFFLSIRNGNYDDFTIMSELISRIRLAKTENRPLDASVIGNYQLTALLKETTGSDSLYFSPNYTHSINAPDLVVTVTGLSNTVLNNGVLSFAGTRSTTTTRSFPSTSSDTKATRQDGSVHLAALIFWRGNDDGDDEVFVKTQMGLYLPIPTFSSQLSALQQAYLNFMSDLLEPDDVARYTSGITFPSEGGNIIIIASAATENSTAPSASTFFPSSSAEDLVMDVARVLLPSFQELSTSVRGTLSITRGFNILLRIGFTDNSSFLMWNYFMGDGWLISDKNSVLQGNIPDSRARFSLGTSLLIGMAVAKRDCPTILFETHTHDSEQGNHHHEDFDSSVDGRLFVGTYGIFTPRLASLISWESREDYLRLPPQPSNLFPWYRGNDVTNKSSTPQLNTAGWPFNPMGGIPWVRIPAYSELTHADITSLPLPSVLSFLTRGSFFASGDSSTGAASDVDVWTFMFDDTPLRDNSDQNVIHSQIIILPPIGSSSSTALWIDNPEEIQPRDVLSTLGFVGISNGFLNSSFKFTKPYHLASIVYKSYSETADVFLDQDDPEIRDGLSALFAAFGQRLRREAAARPYAPIRTRKGITVTVQAELKPNAWIYRGIANFWSGVEANVPLPLSFRSLTALQETLESQSATIIGILPSEISACAATLSSNKREQRTKQQEARQTVDEDGEDALPNNYAEVNFRPPTFAREYGFFYFTNNEVSFFLPPSGNPDNLATTIRTELVLMPLEKSLCFDGATVFSCSSLVASSASSFTTRNEDYEDTFDHDKFLEATINSSPEDVVIFSLKSSYSGVPSSIQLTGSMIPASSSSYSLSSSSSSSWHPFGLGWLSVKDAHVLDLDLLRQGAAMQQVLLSGNVAMSFFSATSFQPDIQMEILSLDSCEPRPPTPPPFSANDPPLTVHQNFFHLSDFLPPSSGGRGFSLSTVVHHILADCGREDERPDFVKKVYPTTTTLLDLRVTSVPFLAIGNNSGNEGGGPPEPLFADHCDQELLSNEGTTKRAGLLLSFEGTVDIGELTEFIQANVDPSWSHTTVAALEVEVSIFSEPCTKRAAPSSSWRGRGRGHDDDDDDDDDDDNDDNDNDNDCEEEDGDCTHSDSSSEGEEVELLFEWDACPADEESASSAKRKRQETNESPSVTLYVQTGDGLRISYPQLQILASSSS